MAEIRIYPPGTTREEIEERRRQEILAMTPAERMKLAFKLMALSAMFKKGPLKEPRGKGVVLKREPK
jgi:hypothetical protein